MRRIATDLLKHCELVLRLPENLSSLRVLLFLAEGTAPDCRPSHSKHVRWSMQHPVLRQYGTPDGEPSASSLCREGGGGASCEAAQVTFSLNQKGLMQSMLRPLSADFFVGI